MSGRRGLALLLLLARAGTGWAARVPDVDEAEAERGSAMLQTRASFSAKGRVHWAEDEPLPPGGNGGTRTDGRNGVEEVGASLKEQGPLLGPTKRIIFMGNISDEATAGPDDDETSAAGDSGGSATGGEAPLPSPVHDTPMEPDADEMGAQEGPDADGDHEGGDASKREAATGPRPGLIEKFRGERPSKSTGGIPGTVFFTGPWPAEEVVERNRQFVPHGTEFRYYNYAQLDQSAEHISGSLASAGVPRAYEALRQLRPYSFRADLWRFMVLWEHGGVYMDAKLTLREDISRWVDMHGGGFVACRDAWRGHYWTAFLAARPGEPLLLDLIRRVVANVESRYYGEPGNRHADLDVTGPGALTRTMEASGYRPREDCRLHFLPPGSVDHGQPVDAKVVQYPQGTTLLVSDQGVHRRMRSCTDCNSYGQLFRAHAIYCDEPVTSLLGDPCNTTRSREALLLGGNSGYWSKIV